MSMNDPIADLLTRLRNAQNAGHATTTVPASKLKANILEVLKREGYIRDYRVEDVCPGVKDLIVELKYYEGKPVIASIKRVSSPGRRLYKAISDLARVSNGLGISILSTPRGVLSDEEARKHNVGGEVICEVY